MRDKQAVVCPPSRTLVINAKEQMTHAPTWMNLKIIVMSEKADQKLYLLYSLFT